MEDVKDNRSSSRESLIDAEVMVFKINKITRILGEAEEPSEQDVIYAHYLLNAILLDPITQWKIQVESRRSNIFTGILKAAFISEQKQLRVVVENTAVGAEGWCAIYELQHLVVTSITSKA